MKNLKPHKLGRHGEVVMLPVSEIPKDAKLVEEGFSIIIGHSESGHHHVLDISTEQGTTIKMYEKDGKTYLDIPLMAHLRHQKTVEKHETQIFEKGLYIREIRESYSYALKAMRRVQD